MTAYTDINSQEVTEQKAVSCWQNVVLISISNTDTDIYSRHITTLSSDTHIAVISSTVLELAFSDSDVNNCTCLMQWDVPECFLLREQDWSSVRPI